MFVNVTVLKIDPARIPEFLDSLYRPEVIRFSRENGIQDAMTFQAVAEPGLIASASLFNTPAEAQRLFSNPFYADLIKSLSGFLLEKPARYSHDVLVHHKFKERLPHMFVNDTILTIDPARVDDFVQTLWAQEVLAVMLATGVFIEAFTFHSLDQPGVIHSVSFYAHPEDARKVFSDPEYASLLGKLKPYLLAAPERAAYTLLRTEEIPFSAQVA